MNCTECRILDLRLELANLYYDHRPSERCVWWKMLTGIIWQRRQHVRFDHAK
jgi:hypothetical protein